MYFVPGKNFDEERCFRRCAIEFHMCIHMQILDLNNIVVRTWYMGIKNRYSNYTN